MRLTKYTTKDYTELGQTYQLVLPLSLEGLIPNDDSVRLLSHELEDLDYTKLYQAYSAKGRNPAVDPKTMFKILTYAYSQIIYSSRKIESACRRDINFMWLLAGQRPPDHSTIARFRTGFLADACEDLFFQMVRHLAAMGELSKETVFIDGTKLEACANKYTWVWKKSCTKNRGKVFEKISMLIDAMNREVLGYFNLKLEKREEYAIDYISKLLELYRKGTGLDESTFVSGCGHRKSIYQKQYQELQGYLERLKTYAHHIEICGEERNSYSKTDHSATCMRLKRDYMGNDQLLPAYNLQTAVCDEYIAVVDVKQYASDMECFIPLMEKFHKTYGRYPKYPVADAGYGSYNNYLYCEEHGMEKYMKFTMFKKETGDKKYHENPYRAVNFQRDESGNLLCPNGKIFRFKCRRPVYKNKYGRTEEVYECESCEGGQHKRECSPKASGNRTIRMNEELSAIYQEVISNLESIHGALLRMNRSIQAEGTFGVLKWDRSYKRLFRRGEKNVILELTLISCGFNIYKYHNKKQRKEAAA